MDNRVVAAILTHFSDVLEGEVGVVDVLLDFGHESVRHVVLVESLDLQQENTFELGVNVGWRDQLLFRVASFATVWLSKGYGCCAVSGMRGTDAIPQRLFCGACNAITGFILARKALLRGTVLQPSSEKTHTQNHSEPAESCEHREQHNNI